MTIALLLIKTLLTSLAKYVFLPLLLTTAASATDAAIQTTTKNWTLHDSINNFRRGNGCMKWMKWTT